MRNVGMVLLWSCLLAMQLFLEGGERRNDLQNERRKDYALVAGR
ncbi:hypothetical protein AB9M62_57185 [Bacillales bacterium AN1005]